MFWVNRQSPRQLEYAMLLHSSSIVPPYAMALCRGVCRVLNFILNIFKRILSVQIRIFHSFAEVFWLWYMRGNGNSTVQCSGLRGPFPFQSWRLFLASFELCNIQAPFTPQAADCSVRPIKGGTCAIFKYLSELQRAYWYSR